MSLKIERQIRVRFPVECQSYVLITLCHIYCTPWQSLSVFMFMWSGVKFSAYLQAVMSGVSYFLFYFLQTNARKIYLALKVYWLEYLCYIFALKFI